MKSRKRAMPEYGTAIMHGVEYYRTRITDPDGNRVAVYGRTPEELEAKIEDIREQIRNNTFCKASPTVKEYCEKWLLMQSISLGFLTKELQKKLLRYIFEQRIIEGCVFITRTGKPISRSNIWREMKDLCEEANVDPRKVFPHNLRHLFARVFYGLEKDIARLADILGHSSVNTTRIYIVSTGLEHRRCMEQMHLVI